MVSLGQEEDCSLVGTNLWCHSWWADWSVDRREISIVEQWIGECLCDGRNLELEDVLEVHHQLWDVIDLISHVINIDFLFGKQLINFLPSRFKLATEVGEVHSVRETKENITKFRIFARQIIDIESDCSHRSSHHWLRVVIQLDCSTVEREVLESLIVEELEEMRSLCQAKRYHLQETNLVINNLQLFWRIELKRNQSIQEGAWEEVKLFLFIFDVLDKNTGGLNELPINNNDMIVQQSSKNLENTHLAERAKG